MKAVLVLFGGNLQKEAFEPVLDGKNSITLCLEQAKKFPYVEKIVFLRSNDDAALSFLGNIQVEAPAEGKWTKQSLLEKIAHLQSGFDMAYFAFADCPFLDASLTEKLAGRHLEQRAEYSYADGWPFGITPEILSPGTAAILAKILGDNQEAVEKDVLFSVIRKDINAFDIEAEISKVDLRCHRLNFCADSKRNFLLINNFITEAGGKIPCAGEIEKIIEEKPQILRTLPAFYPVQVSGLCPQNCTICPYPIYHDPAQKEFMKTADFEALLEKIVSFSGDAVIDLSLWGELSLHPEKLKIIEAVLAHNSLSLVIETSGIGWKMQELEETARLLNKYANKSSFKKHHAAALSWIVSLDTIDANRYTQLRGGGFAEAQDCAKKLLSLFPQDCYVQAVRLKGSEEDTEKFYRYWKNETGLNEKNIIIQKYDDFCGSLEKKQASDISPLIRKPCWHIMRDMPVLLNGAVPCCRENLNALKLNKNCDLILGNVFNASLESIWKKGEYLYMEHCRKNYPGICENCDEYYTYNF